MCMAIVRHGRKSHGIYNIHTFHVYNAQHNEYLNLTFEKYFSIGDVNVRRSGGGQGKKAGNCRELLNSIKHLLVNDVWIQYSSDLPEHNYNFFFKNLLKILHQQTIINIK